MYMMYGTCDISDTRDSYICLKNFDVNVSDKIFKKNWKTNDMNLHFKLISTIANK